MQKYQVFINEHCIEWSDRPTKYEHFAGFLSVKKPKGEIYKLVVEWLLQEVKPMHIFFKCGKVEDAWQEFVAQFKFIAAAGGIVNNLDGDILVIKRLGKWDLPKGKVEAGERIPEAALREVEEECGIDGLELGSKLPSTFHIYPHKGKVVLKETHWFEMSTQSKKSLIPQVEEDIEEVRWADQSQLEKVMADTYPSLKTLIKPYLV